MKTIRKSKGLSQQKLAVRLFVRIAPMILIGSIIGVFLTMKRE